jgi:hypothetical protein
MQTPRFAHPGTFMSPAMTRTLKAQSQTHPERAKALAKLIRETPLTYTPQALHTVDIGFGGKGMGHIQCTKDGEMVVSCAILYWATSKEAYADKAIAILKAWATTNKVWRGDNALLEAAWSICSMARAAELLKYSFRAQAWQAIEPAFFAWLDTVIMPVLKSEHIWRWKPINNWHFSQICARMQIAILREDTAEWQWCIQRYPVALNQALLFQKCPGETTETCRDVTHNQFQLGGLMQAAEMALHQGIRLDDDRLHTCFELQARIMMKEIPPGLTKEDIKTPHGYWYEPIWHMAHAHFVGRKKMPMPKTEQYIKQIGPDRVCFHWGPNCLTHYRRT